MSIKTTTAGFDVVFTNYPATSAEYDAKAGPTESGLPASYETALLNDIWRDGLPKAHAIATPLLEALTGEKRGINIEQTEKAQARATALAEKKGVPAPIVKPVSETFNKFAARAEANYAGSDEAKRAEIGAVLQKAVDQVEIDPSPTARAAAVNKGDLAKADQILALSIDEIEVKVAKIEAVIGTETIDRDEETSKPTRDSLARAIGLWVKASL